MASELGETKQILIGAAIGPSIGSVFNTIENRLKHLEQQGSQLKLLQGAIKEARSLEAEFEALEDKGSSSAISLQANLDAVRQKLKDQKVDVTRLDDAYQTLGRAMEGIEQQKKGMQLISEGKAALAQTKTTISTVMVPVKAAAAFDDKVMNIFVKASEEERAVTTKADFSKTVGDVSKDSGMASGDVVALIGELQASGLGLGDALARASVAAKFSASQGVDAKDTAKLVSSLSKAGVAPADMERVLGGLAAQAKGKDGAVDIAGVSQAMAKLLPALGKNASAESVLRLGAAVQVTVGSAENAEDGIKELKTSLKDGQLAKPETAKTVVEAGKQSEYEAFVKKGTEGGSTLEDDIALRKTPSQNLKDASNAVEDLKRDFGAILLPTVGELAKTFAGATRAANELMNSFPGPVAAITGLGVVVSTLGGVFGAFKTAKGAMDVGVGLFKQQSGNMAAGPAGVVQRAGALLGGGGPVDVAVVNMGGGVPGPLGSSRNGQNGGAFNENPVITNVTDQAPLDGPRETEKDKKTAAKSKKSGGLGRVFSFLTSGAKAVAKRTPVGRVVDAGFGLADILLGGGSTAEKAVGVASMAGGLGGAWGGAAAGAAIGSVIPGVGTLLGGAIGAALGAGIGQEAVGWIGDRFLGRKQRSTPTPASTRAQTQDPVATPAKVQTQPSTTSTPTVQMSDQQNMNNRIHMRAGKGGGNKNSQGKRKGNAKGTAGSSSADQKRPGQAAGANPIGRTTGSGNSGNGASSAKTESGNNSPLPSSGGSPSSGVALPHQPVSFSPNVSINLQGFMPASEVIVRQLEEELRKLWARFQAETKLGAPLFDPAMQ